jgi:hypothetical protein
MAGAASSSPVMICSADLTWRLAQGADALIDDGVPNTGAVMSYLQNGKVLADAANPTRGSPVITFDSKLEDALYTVCQHK